MAVDGGDGDGIAQTQVVEFIDVRTLALVHLVHRQHHWLAAPLKHGGHLLIGGGHAGLDVAEEHDDRGVVNGDLGLRTHEGKDLIIRPRLDAAGVDEGELPALPVALPVDPVAGHAGGVLHNGQPPADDLIEQHGLAHIGAAHDGDDRFRHKMTPFLSGVGVFRCRRKKLND